MSGSEYCSSVIVSGLRRVAAERLRGETGVGILNHARDVASAVYLVAVSRRRSSACSGDPVSAAPTWVGIAVDVRIHGVSGRVSGA